MKPSRWFKNKIEEFKDDFDFRLETIILDLTESICEQLEKKKINRSQFADLLNVSPPAVSKILNGTSNFTLKTMLSIADALDLEFNVEYAEKQTSAFSIKIEDRTFEVSTAESPSVFKSPMTGEKISAADVGWLSTAKQMTETTNAYSATEA